MPNIYPTESLYGMRFCVMQSTDRLARPLLRLKYSNTNLNYLESNAKQDEYFTPKLTSTMNMIERSVKREERNQQKISHYTR